MRQEKGRGQAGNIYRLTKNDSFCKNNFARKGKALPSEKRRFRHISERRCCYADYVDVPYLRIYGNHLRKKQKPPLCQVTVPLF